MKLALLQMHVSPGDASLNLGRARELAVSARSAGAHLVLLPEALPFGWMDPACQSSAEPIPGKHFDFFATLAQEHRIYVCTGLIERAGSRIYNSAVLISPRGELLLHHRKIYELDIAHECYALGDRLGVAETEHGRMGLMICADGFAPGQAISRTLCLMGAQLILSPCAWAVPPAFDNSKTPYGQLWLESYGAVARDFPVWITGCSNVGPIRSGAWSGHKCIGSSLVVGPGGEAVLRGPCGEKAEAILEFDLELPKTVPRSRP